MAAVARWLAGAATLAACADLRGLEPGQPSPLASLHVRVTGDLDAVRAPGPKPARLRVAILWGQPWLPDASCLPPIENADQAEVVAVGCDDPLGFRRADFERTEDVAIEPDGTATLDLYSLPSTLFGDMYSQIAYASLIVYDDMNGNDILDHGTDILYGASFSSMTRPDTRVAFRHGGFDDRAAYYPRRGCEPPSPGYSLVSAGGFTLDQAVDAQARGELPAQDPARCHRDAIDHEVAVQLRPPEEVGAVNCIPFAYQFSPPQPVLPPGSTRFKTACTSLPDRGTGRARGRYQLLMARDPMGGPLPPPSGFPGGCKFVEHYVLRGCYSDPLCEAPDWNVPPPSWWPCPREDVR